MSEAQAIDRQSIIERVQGLYADARVEVNGEGCNLEMLVVSDAFRSMPVMKRQQSILKLFGQDLSSGRLHALSVRCKTGSEIAAAQSRFVQLEV